MERNQTFQNYYSRMVREGILKSVLCGFIVGFVVNFVAAFVAWLFDFNGLWLAIGLGIGVAVISGVLFYFCKFRPTNKEIARRVDQLGLEERLITMMELENDDSYIAMRQREDAKEHLSRVDKKQLKFRIPKAVIAMVAAFAVFGTGMTVVAELSANDTIRSGLDLIDPDRNDPMLNYIAVSYIAENGGTIEGNEEQLILIGEDAEAVTAVADDGWMFVAWDDGSEDPGRADTAITEEVVYTALFERIGEGDGEGDGEGEGEGQGEGDQPSDQPGEGEGEGQGEEGNGEGEGEGEGEGQGEGEGEGKGASGQYEESNQVIDNSTYYRSVYDYYYDMAMEYVENGEEVPPEIAEIIQKYFGSI